MPMESKNKRYVIVFNGEIYNFKELREEILKKGIELTTTSDTEVLLTMYQLYREKSLNYLNGMFSFAILDKKNKSIFLARDRFGIKPLYFYKSNRLILFASEIKAFIPFVKKFNLKWEISNKIISEYMIFRYNSGCNTLIRNVYRCLPGQFLKINQVGKIKKYLYYKNPSHVENTRENISINEATKILQSKLSKSISYRLISDAPVGIALSGGLDSSIITALTSKLKDSKIKTFSVVFNEKNIDESNYSDKIAKMFNTDHHRIVFDPKNFNKLLARCTWYNDEPLNFPNSVGIYLLSRYASRHVKVLLGGEGADEIFAGYNFFRKKSHYPLKNRMIRINDLYNLIHPKRYSNDFKNFLHSKSDFLSPLNQEIDYNLHTYLQTIENRADKMSMAASIEMRLPFLDHKIVDLAFSLPDGFKLSASGKTKYILKRLGEKFFPHDFVNRPKIGFSVPINKWFKNNSLLGNQIKILLEERTLSREYLNADGVKSLVKNFANRKDSFKYSMAGRLWILLALEIWNRTIIEDQKIIK